MPMRAPAAATTRSACRVIIVPPAIASPCSAATTGCGYARIASHSLTSGLSCGQPFS